jgi:hypothetical protein
MNNFCFRVNYKFEIHSELKFQSLICSLNRKIIYLAVKLLTKKSIKTHLCSSFHNIIQMEFIFNTISFTVLEICVLNLNLNKRIQKNKFLHNNWKCKFIFINILVNLMLCLNWGAYEFKSCYEVLKSQRLTCGIYMKL